MKYTRNAIAKAALVFFVFFLSLLLVLASLWISKNFGHTSLQSIVFTMTTPLSGVPLPMVFSFAARAFLGLGIAALLALAFLRLTRRLYAAGRKQAARALLLIPLAALFVSLGYIEKQHGIVAYLKTISNYSTFIDEHYVAPADLAITFPERKKNLVLLVLESMENTLYEAMPEPVNPKLKALQERSLTFKNLKSVTGTEWTVAGLTSYLFGLPVNLPLDWNQYDQRFQTFLPNATSLLEVMEGNGYSINLVMGTSADFSGIRNLFTGHTQNAHIYDKEYFLTVVPPGEKRAFSPWGIIDSYLYEYSKDVLTAISKEEQPFFTVIMSIDTHSPAATYGDCDHPFGDERDAFYAADHMASEFIQWIAGQEFYKDTVLVVIGDHRYMAESMGGIALPKHEDRHTYNAFLHTGIPQQERYLQRAFSAVDIAPTLLESIGATVPGRSFGLGVSLLSDMPTLVERYGFETVDTQFVQRSRLYDGFIR